MGWYKQIERVLSALVREKSRRRPRIEEDICWKGGPKAIEPGYSFQDCKIRLIPSYLGRKYRESRQGCRVIGNLVFAHEVPKSSRHFSRGIPAFTAARQPHSLEATQPPA
jgi:hypothetical protein